MTRWAAVAVAVMMAGCSQSGPVVYRAGPPPPNGAQVYAAALRNDGWAQRHEQERQARMRHQEQMDMMRRQEMLLQEQQRQMCRSRDGYIC